MASPSTRSTDSNGARTIGVVVAILVVIAFVIAFRAELNVTWFHGSLHEEDTIGQFLFVTLLLGGWAAWMTGRACAQTWRPISALVFYLLLLGIAVRFIHHALFGGSMFTFYYYAIDTVFLVVIGIIGYRYTRTNQMVTQYYWLYEKASLLSWKSRVDVHH